MEYDINVWNGIDSGLCSQKFKENRVGTDVSYKVSTTFHGIRLEPNMQYHLFYMIKHSRSFLTSEVDGGTNIIVTYQIKQQTEY